ncbi:MAG: ABC transporter ATP-binding protein [Pseudomonadota bacterium]
MVELKDIEFSYREGRFRLQIPSLTVAEGEHVAVVGPSGTGKTTLLNLVSGIIRPSAGSLRVAGVPLETRSDDALRHFRASTVGFVFQDFALLDYLSARENILYPYRISPALRLNTEVRQRAETLADQVGLGQKLERHPTALSQGEQQRVAICRALVTQPKLVLSDEATGNLDPDNKTLILDLLFKQAALAGASVLAVTHDHALLPRFDRVIDFAAFQSATTVAAV